MCGFHRGVDFSNFIITPKQKTMSVLKDMANKYSHHSLLGPDPVDSFPIVDSAQPKSFALEPSQRPKFLVRGLRAAHCRRSARFA